jgi:hypothetical protein
MSSERDSFAKGIFSTFAKGFLLHKLLLKVNFSPLRVKKSRSHDMGHRHLDHVSLFCEQTTLAYDVGMVGVGPNMHLIFFQPHMQLTGSTCRTIAVVLVVISVAAAELLSLLDKIVLGGSAKAEQLCQIRVSRKLDSED